MATSQTARVSWGKALVAIAVIVLVFWVNARFVLVHFSSGGHLLDTGWFAWIMASGDPWLKNPSAINDLSYYTVHVSPWLSGVTVLAKQLGIDRFSMLALHQGLLFAVLAGALIEFGFRSRGAGAVVAVAAVFLFVTTGDLLLQIASYPHFEIAILAFCAVGLALGTRGHPVLAALAFLLATLVREDGGLYAAVFIAATAALSRRWAVLLGVVPAIGISVSMFVVQRLYFPGFSAFAYNYSGNNWDHLTTAFVTGRLTDFVQNPIAMATLLVALGLATQSRRALIVPLLFVPLIVAQLIAARTQLGHFRLYYAMPFLAIWIGGFALASRRGEVRHPVGEAVMLLVGTLAIWGPVQFALTPPSSFPVFAAALTRPVTDLPALADATASALVPGACVSKGVAAIAPDAVTAEQVIDPDSDVSACKTVYLFNGDLDYPQLAPRMADRIAGPVLDGRVERYDQRP